MSKHLSKAPSTGTERGGDDPITLVSLALTDAQARSLSNLADTLGLPPAEALLRLALVGAKTVQWSGRVRGGNRTEDAAAFRAGLSLPAREVLTPSDGLHDPIGRWSSALERLPLEAAPGTCTGCLALAADTCAKRTLGLRAGSRFEAACCCRCHYQPGGAS